MHDQNRERGERRSGPLYLSSGICLILVIGALTYSRADDFETPAVPALIKPRNIIKVRTIGEEDETKGSPPAYGNLSGQEPAVRFAQRPGSQPALGPAGPQFPGASDPPRVQVIPPPAIPAADPSSVPGDTRLNNVLNPPTAPAATPLAESPPILLKGRLIGIRSAPVAMLEVSGSIVVVPEGGSITVKGTAISVERVSVSGVQLVLQPGDRRMDLR